MRSRRRSALAELRLAVGCLPVRTRRAMLEGIGANTIIVGAYTDRRGGVCPMLAAHRCGGRTDFLAFAHAWDRFTGARRPRPATEREIGVLVALLQDSLLADGPDLGTAIDEHRRSARARRAREAHRVGWSWLAEAEAQPEARAGDEREPVAP